MPCNGLYLDCKDKVSAREHNNKAGTKCASVRPPKEDRLNPGFKILIPALNFFRLYSQTFRTGKFNKKEENVSLSVCLSCMTTFAAILESKVQNGRLSKGLED